MGVGWNLNPSVFIRRGEDTERHTGKMTWKMTLDWYLYEYGLSSIARRHQKLGWGRKGSHPPLVPSETWPCWDLDFEHPASKTVRQLISGVLNCPICSNLLQKPQETDKHGVVPKWKTINWLPEDSAEQIIDKIRKKARNSWWYPEGVQCTGQTYY